MGYKDDLRRRGVHYARQHALVLGDELGTGVHGSVFLAECLPENAPPSPRSAIKVHNGETGYRQERDVYLRFRQNKITAIRGCHVPRLLRHDDTLWIIEMTVVTRPFVLDFAGSSLDRAVDFSEEVLADQLVENKERFGTDWPEVRRILNQLEAYGVFLIDVTPNNIALSE